MRKWTWMTGISIALFALLATAPAWAAELEAQEVLGPYVHSESIVAASLDFTMASIITPVTTTLTGREVLVVYNSDISAATLTIESVMDPFGMKSDIHATIPAGGMCAFYFGDRTGWDGGGGVKYSALGVNVMAAMLRLPQQPKHIQPASAAVSYPSNLLVGPHPGGIPSTALQVTQTAGTSPGNFLATGGDLFICHNTHDAPASLSLVGSRDTSPYKRSKIITVEQAPDEWTAYYFGDYRGWATRAGVITVSTTSADQMITVLRVP